MRILIFIYFISILGLEGQQIAIEKVDRMADLPKPFLMRDWKKVAVQYDSIVYNQNWTGDYLPLLNFSESGTQYPNVPQFGLDTYVGWNTQSTGEAINVLPSIVSASLCGVDKTNQYGRNWVLYSQNYFNHANDEDIYLNSVSGGSGSDWWYDVMPNVFFYQIFDLYGSIDDSESQFLSVADQFLTSVINMGGSDIPWQATNMNYRAYDFKTETPNPNGVQEPEAAGAYAWILYHAYKYTGNTEYLKGAEWCMEFLDQLDANPSYELQLPYGVYAASKMNAEINTTYDIEKMMNWVFDRGPLRGWGTTAGIWSGLDMSGLVGENNENGNDYVFLLNGIHQASTLVPAIRYDKRFAHAIAKYTLNVANASRYFYPKFLPESQQDGSAWSELYDPLQVIAHEAIREQINGVGPIATGDAVKGEWAATNLSLYSSSSIGYLGSLIEKTDVDGILKLDLTRTDFYNDSTYPSYLVYNPHNQMHQVSIALEPGTSRIYNAISEVFMDPPSSSTYLLDLNPKEVVMLVLIDEPGEPKYEQGKLWIHDQIVDYRSSSAPQVFPPRIQSLAAEINTVIKKDSLEIFGKVQDKDNDLISYQWLSEFGDIQTTDTRAVWIAPDSLGDYDIHWIVKDASGLVDSAKITIQVVEQINRPPIIQEISIDRLFQPTFSEVPISLEVSDPDGDSLDISWFINNERIDGPQTQFVWMTESEGIYSIKVVVDDRSGESVEESIKVLVKDFVIQNESNAIAIYPFNGNTHDESGNELHGQVFGAKLTSDQNGNSSAAYTFDGVNDYIQIENDPLLGFGDAMTLSLFFNMSRIPDKEVFLVSHGSWQNRWKVSITPDLKVRWTIHLENGVIKDLDSELIINSDSTYQVVVTYDGAYMFLYIDGMLESFIEVSGKIKQVELPMLFAQMLPDNSEFNFPGILDEIKLWDYARIPQQVERDFNGLNTYATIHQTNNDFITLRPNPVSEYLEIEINGNYNMQNIDIELLGINGKVLYQTEGNGTNRHMIPLGDLDLISGLYLVIVKAGQNICTKKFIKK